MSDRNGLEKKKEKVALLSGARTRERALIYECCRLYRLCKGIMLSLLSGPTLLTTVMLNFLLTPAQILTMYDALSHMI